MVAGCAHSQPVVSDASVMGPGVSHLDSPGVEHPAAVRGHITGSCWAGLFSPFSFLKHGSDASSL